MAAADFEVGPSRNRVSRARSIAFIDDAPTDVRQASCRGAPADTRAARSLRATRAHGSTDLSMHFERQATHLLHALSLALKENVDRGLICDYCRAARASRARSRARRARPARGIAARSTLRGPNETATARFYTQRALAWRKALRGDWIPAMHLLDGAFAFAPDAMRRGLIFADRARISMAIGEHVSAASSRANAFECFSEIDWDGASQGRGHRASLRLWMFCAPTPTALSRSLLCAEASNCLKTVGSGPRSPSRGL